MNPFKEDHTASIIGNLLLDKLEKSRAKHPKPCVKVTEKAVTSLFDKAHYPDTEKSLKFLEKCDLIRLDYDKTDHIQKVYLNVDQANGIYHDLDRGPKDNVLKTQIEWLTDKTFGNPVSAHLANAEIAWLKAGNTLTTDNGIYDAIDAVYYNTEDLTYREFSEKLYSDPETFMRYAKQVGTLIYDNQSKEHKTGSLKPWQSALAWHHLYLVPPYIFVKGPCELQYEGGGLIRHPATLDDDGIAIAARGLKNLTYIRTGRHVVFVKEKNAFFEKTKQEASDTTVFLVSYDIKTLVTLLIKKIKQYNPDISLSDE